MASDDSSGESSLQGSCSDTALWELEVEADDGRLEVEFEITSAAPGQEWDYTITGPGGVVGQGTKTASSDGSVKIEVKAEGSPQDGFAAVASSAEETCDSTTGSAKYDGEDSDDDSLYDDEDSDDDSKYDDEDSDDDSLEREGSCTAASQISLEVKRATKVRTATLKIRSSRNGQKWRFTIKRGKKVVKRGVKATKGPRASFVVKTSVKGNGRLTGKAAKLSGREKCSTGS